MKIMNDLLNRYKKLADEASLGDGTLRSKNWFNKIVASQKNVRNINRVVEGLDKPSLLKPGMLIVFYYAARYADKLEYWDKHPLVMINSVTRDGWTGENLHYLHPRHRARMIYDSQRKRTSVFNPTDPMQHRLLPFCNKKYFASNASMVREVPQELWELVIQLPFENFQKQSKTAVWKDTTRKGNKR